MRPQTLAAARSRTVTVGATWRWVLGTFVLSRVVFVVAGAIGAAVVSPASHAGTARSPGGALGYWAHWDGAWFAGIAEHGYDSAASSAFFPLYPLLIRVGTMFGLGPAVAGVLISLAAFLAALYFLYELAEAELGTRVARASTLALAFFPTAFFLNAVYSESLFLACATGTLWSLRVRRSLPLAGAFGYFAAATRNVGILLVLPMAYEWWKRGKDRRLSGLAPIALVSASLAAYMLFLWKVSKKPLLLRSSSARTGGGASRIPSAPSGTAPSRHGRAPATSSTRAASSAPTRSTRRSAPRTPSTSSVSCSCWCCSSPPSACFRRACQSLPQRYRSCHSRTHRQGSR